MAIRSDETLQTKGMCTLAFLTAGSWFALGIKNWALTSYETYGIIPVVV
ncbi:MAG: hypothetical protein PVJ32_05710 [Anaerolineales bacterium]